MVMRAAVEAVDLHDQCGRAVGIFLAAEREPSEIRHAMRIGDECESGLARVSHQRRAGVKANPFRNRWHFGERVIEPDWRFIVSEALHQRGGRRRQRRRCVYAANFSNLAGPGESFHQGAKGGLAGEGRIWIERRSSLVLPAHQREEVDARRRRLCPCKNATLLLRQTQRRQNMLLDA